MKQSMPIVTVSQPYDNDKEARRIPSDLSTTRNRDYITQLQEERPLIITARLAGSQSALDKLKQLRKDHFPEHRNFLEPHVTLFHHLPAHLSDRIRDFLTSALVHLRRERAEKSDDDVDNGAHKRPLFPVQVVDVMPLGTLKQRLKGIGRSKTYVSRQARAPPLLARPHAVEYSLVDYNQDRHEQTDSKKSDVNYIDLSNANKRPLGSRESPISDHHSVLDEQSGVAYQLECSPLIHLQSSMQDVFHNHLTRQDAKRFTSATHETTINLPLSDHETRLHQRTQNTSRGSRQHDQRYTLSQSSARVLHVTLQNKAPIEKAHHLYEQLHQDFGQLDSAVGQSAHLYIAAFDVWHYCNGLWEWSYAVYVESEMGEVGDTRDASES